MRFRVCGVYGLGPRDFLFRVGCSGLRAWESLRLRVLDVPVRFSSTATT